MILKIVLFPFRVALAVACVVVILAAAPVLVSQCSPYRHSVFVQRAFVVVTADTISVCAMSAFIFHAA